MHLDHVVIRVDDLERATDAWRDLGFTVLAGGDHGRYGTRNALVPFADGAYLELVAFRADRPADAALPGETRPQALARLEAAGRSRFEARWLSQAAAPEGPVDLCLTPGLSAGADPHEADLALRAELAALRARGVDLAAPLPMGRARPDGVRLQWRMLHPAVLELPFLIHDETPRGERVPRVDAHPNGASRVAEVALAVSDAAAAAARWRALLARDGTPARDAEGRPATAFELGAARLLLASAGTDAELGARLHATGASPYAVTLAGAGISPLDLTVEGTRLHLRPA